MVEWVWRDADEEALIDEAAAALVRTGLDQIVDLVAATVVTSARDAQGDDEAWVAAIAAALAELPCDESHRARDVFDALRAAGVVDWRYALGTDVWAVLDEDGEWHEATVSGPLLSHGTQLVTFVEWHKVQQVERAALCPIDDDGVADGSCETCERLRPLTFHHLVPKEVHHLWIGRAPPSPLRRERGDQPMTKAALGSHGILVCRPCHAAIHRSASNRELAARYCTRAALLHDNAMFARFVRYAEKRRR